MASAAAIRSLRGLFTRLQLARKRYQRTLAIHQKRPVMPSSKLVHALVAGGLFLLALLLYWQTYSYNDYIFDSASHIPDNDAIAMESLSFDALRRAATESGLKRRPVAYISLALNHLFTGYDAGAIRLTNTIIHAIAALLVYVLSLVTLRLYARLPSTADGLRGRMPVERCQQLAMAMAFIWMAHPIQVQSVTYTIQRMNSLAVLFYLAAVCAYLWGRSTDNRLHEIAALGGCLLCGALGLGTKEFVITLPIALFLYEWYFFQDLSGEWLKRHAKIWLVPIGLAGVIGLIMVGENPFARIMRGYDMRDFTMMERMWTQARVVVFYLSLFILPLPSRLNLEHHFHVSSSALSPIATGIGLLLLVVLGGIAVCCAKRDRVLSFGIIWLFLHLAVESTFLPLEIVFEHRMTLPMVGAVFAIVFFVYQRAPLSQSAYIGLAVLAVAALGIGTFQRNKVWHSAISVWRDCIAKSPEKARPYHNLGVLVREKGDRKEALELFQKAVEYRPEYTDAQINVGVELVRLNRHHDAIPHFLKAAESDANHVDARMNLGNAYRDTNQAAKAIEAYRAALKLAPNPKTYYNLGKLLSSIGKHEKAVAQFNKALALDSKHASSRNELGNTYRKLKQYERAIAELQQTLKDDPDFVLAHYNLGVTYFHRDQPKLAIKHLDVAHQKSPKDANVLVVMGHLMMKQTKYKEAERFYLKAVALNPRLVAPHNNLAVILRQRGDLAAAAKHLRTALKAEPGNKNARISLQTIERELEAAKQAP